jgi:NADH dehydrogenase
VSGKRVLIVGGGFGGVYTAMALERRLRRVEGAEISLVTRDNYLVYQPMLAEVVSGSIGLVDTIAPIRRLCPRTNLYAREVESIDLQRRVVMTSSGLSSNPLALEADHLVIAVGNVTQFGGGNGLEEHAFPFKYLGDALVLRNHIISVLEEADIETDVEARRSLLTFVVAGGGFSGVEVIAEINDFVRDAARSFRNIDRSLIRVVLLHSMDLILPEMPATLGRFAQSVLQRRGVEMRLNTLLAGATADYALLANGERIATRTLVSTVPSGPNPLLRMLDCRQERGKVVVDGTLQVPDHPGVWALGDCALVPEALSGENCPPTAQHATRQANTLAHNIAAEMTGGTKKVFAFKALGLLASLGHHKAAAVILGVRVSGLPAWFLWRTIYLMKMPGLDRKIRVVMDWTLALFLKPDIVQMKTQRAAGMCRQHFGAREVIFRQGEHGDRLYIVVDGEVEVVQETGAGEVVLATLGAGEWFGEMALVDSAPRNATARSVTDVKLLTVNDAAFDTLFRHLPPLRGVFQRMIEERMTATIAARTRAAGDA